MLLSIIFIAAFGAAGIGTNVLSDDQLEESPAPDGPEIQRTPQAPAAAAINQETDAKAPTTTPAQSEPQTPAVTLTLSGPSDVANAAGTVESLHGTLDGSVSWGTADIDRVTVVVSTWVPDHGWKENRRATFTPNEADRQSFDAIFGSTNITLAENGRSTRFEPAADGTAVTDGYVAVTVTARTGGGTAQTQQLSEYTVAVTNLDVGSAASSELTDIELAPAETTLLDVSNAAPGQQETNTVPLENIGSDDGTLDIIIKDFDVAEGGITEPERPVDTPGKVELAEELEIRVAISRTNDSSEYIVGDANEFVPISDISTGPIRSDASLESGERIQIRAEWRIDPTVGNEIQSDAVSLDVAYVLKSD